MWSPQRDGVLFGKYGTIFGEDQVSVSGPRGGGIELWTLPTKWSGSATVLSVYQPDTGSVFKLHQALTDLEIEYETESGGLRPNISSLTAREAFGPALRHSEPAFITVTYGADGLAVYVNGKLAASDPGFRLNGGLSGRLIVGDAPRQPDSFRGKVRGLAILASELNASDVWAEYRRWVEHASPGARDYKALYLFDEGQGRVIENHAGSAGRLWIPEKYTVVDKIALEPFWREFDFTREYWSGNLKNVIGFVPVGFIFYAYFRMARGARRPALYTMVVGILLSVTIEVLQAFLPMRDSGTTDIFTNAFGTYIGVVLFRGVTTWMRRRFPDQIRSAESGLSAKESRW